MMKQFLIAFALSAAAVAPAMADQALAQAQTDLALEQQDVYDAQATADSAAEALEYAEGSHDSDVDFLGRGFGVGCGRGFIRCGDLGGGRGDLGSAMTATRSVSVVAG